MRIHTFASDLAYLLLHGQQPVRALGCRLPMLWGRTTMMPDLSLSKEGTECELAGENIGMGRVHK